MKFTNLHLHKSSRLEVREHIRTMQLRVPSACLESCRGEWCKALDQGAYSVAF